MNKSNIKRIAALALVLVMAFFMLSACSGGHAPGYGNTSKCTICGKPATHSTGNYGYCDKHWQDAINYNGN